MIQFMYNNAQNKIIEKTSFKANYKLLLRDLKRLVSAQILKLKSNVEHCEA